MNLKTEIFKMASSALSAALTIGFDKDENKWIAACAAFLGIYVLFSLFEYRKKILRWLKCIFSSIRKEPFIESVPGFCGRENVISEIYRQYCSTKGIRTILICGLGGSGKTTIYTYFKKVLINSPRVALFSDESSAKNIRKKTILFVDYAFESLGAIKDLISKLKENNKKKILIVLLERTYAQQHLEYDELINLNDSKYTLTVEQLASIISFNVKNVKLGDSYVNSEETITPEQAKKFAKQIVDKIDPP